MRYFHSQKNFNQYKPHRSFWQRFKSRQKNKPNVVIKDNSLKNPFKKEKATHKNKNKIVWIFLIFIISIWIAIIFTIPYFRINKIIIEGNKINKASDVEEFARQTNNFNNGLLPRTNYFLFKGDILAQEIKQEFLYEDVKIDKVFPDTIKIIVIEKPAAVIFDDNTNYYLLDPDGKVIKKINITSNVVTENLEDTTSTTSTIPLDTTTTLQSSTSTFNNYHNRTQDYDSIQNTYGQLPIIKTDKPTVISKKIIELVGEWQKNIKQQGVGEVEYFYLGGADFNLKITLKDDSWYILINTDLDWQTQMKNLKIILANNKPTEYIDLRFGERVYWK